MTVRLVFVRSREITRIQKVAEKKLEAECFGSLDKKELREQFFARSFGVIFAYEEATITGYLKVCFRRVGFEGTRVSLGGITKVSETSAARDRGIASAMVVKALEVFK